MAPVRNVLLLMLSAAMAAPISPSPVDEEKARIHDMTEAEKAAIPSLVDVAHNRHKSEPMQKASPPTIIVNSGDVASAAEADALHPPQKPHEGLSGSSLLGALAGQAEHGPLGNSVDDKASRLADEYIEKVKGDLHARQLLPGDIIGKVPGVVSDVANAYIDGIKSKLQSRDEMQTPGEEHHSGNAAKDHDSKGHDSKDHDSKDHDHDHDTQSHDPHSPTTGLKPAQAIDAVHLATDIEDWVRGGLTGAHELERRQGLSGSDLPGILMGIAADPKKKLGDLTKGINFGGKRVDLLPH
ncbi:hypothetical protein VTN96DRAFT_7991 [Rasamsonia emersonii]